jgi:hypothetical protein
MNDGGRKKRKVGVCGGHWRYYDNNKKVKWQDGTDEGYTPFQLLMSKSPLQLTRKAPFQMSAWSGKDLY